MFTIPNLKRFDSAETFTLESGVTLPKLHLAYHTYGEMNAAKDNVVWVCHALTANSDAADWWSGMVGAGKLFDPSKDFIVCANVPGSCYGSLGPLSENPETGEPYYASFPWFTIRDVVRAFDLLRQALGVEKIKIGIGGSMGGQQLMEWAIYQPKLFQNLIPIATNARHSPWGIAFNEAQRLALLADQTFLEHSPTAGQAGLKAARSIAMLSYRNYNTYLEKQSEENVEIYDAFRAASYQDYQGQKLVKRFNAHAYYALTKCMDSHNVGRGRNGIRSALALIQSPTLIIGVSSDLLFPVDEQQEIARQIPLGVYTEIDSLYGHDGFLIEFKKLTNVIKQFLKKPKQ